MTRMYWPIKGNKGFNDVVSFAAKQNDPELEILALEVAYSKGNVMVVIDNREKYIEKRIKHDGIT